MNLISCHNPKRIWNEYTQEFVYAPCGTCPMCVKRRVSNWVSRLIQERYSWRYCVFFTLTYDNDNVPTLKCDESHRFYYDLSNSHPNSDGNVFIDTNEFEYDTDALKEKNFAWLQKNDKVYYLSRGDAQRFMKRLRINLSRAVKAQIKLDKSNNIKTSLSDKDEKIRYYLCGEYGSTFLRPHYHGLLFFNSSFTASHVAELISKSWKLGAVDSSFVSSHNSSYVAGYVNSANSLPAILRYRSIRPFALYSKHPFIGSLAHNSKEVKEIFFSASPDFTIFNHEKSSFDNVPLWKSYQRQLYPKLSGFSKFSHVDRVNLYRAFERFEKITDEPNYPLFCDYVNQRLNRVYVPSLYYEYASYLISNSVSPSDALRSWYYMSMRVYHQARSFEINVSMYVSFIERFYQNVEKRKLSSQFELQENLFKDGHLVNALALDLEFVRLVTNCELEDLDGHEVEQLLSFGIDVGKFYSNDLDERERYRKYVLGSGAVSILKTDSEVWLNDHTKIKFKNDYLRHHLEKLDYTWLDKNILNEF